MKYMGKEKCRILKQIRAEIARQNDIEWVVSECHHQGNCRGTCPKCEQEVRELEKALARRQAIGKTVAVVGISASMALSVTGCDSPLTAAQGKMENERDPGGQTVEQTVEKTTEIDPGEVVVGGTEPIIYETSEGEFETQWGDEMGDVTIPLPGEVVEESEPESETEEDSEEIVSFIGDPAPDAENE